MIALPFILFASIGILVAACKPKKTAPPVSAPSSLPPSVPSSSSVGDPLKKKSSSHAATDFALSLLRATCGPAANCVISPLSLGSALVMLHDGARGDTQAEFTTLLGKTLCPDDVSMIYATLAKSLANQDSSVQIRTANRLFIDKAFTVKPEYQTRVEKAFNARVDTLNFSDESGSANTVNAFVKKSTDGLIPAMVDARAFDGDAKSLVISAVYFKGGWKVPFYTDETRKQTFYGVHGKGEMEFMVAKDRHTRYSISGNLVVVALSYEDPAYSMLLLMPKRGNFGGWRGKLTAKCLHGAISNLRKGEINLRMPKWTIEATADVKTALQQLGVKHVFLGSADLSGMTDKEQLCLSTIMHKAVFRVSEQGTEAAGATACEYIKFGISDAPNVVLDRPFLYGIIRNDQDIVFLGQMTDAEGPEGAATEGSKKDGAASQSALEGAESRKTEASIVNGNDATGGNTTNIKREKE